MFRVRQIFETLGDPAQADFSTMEQAAEYAAGLVLDLAAMIREWEVEPTPLSCLLADPERRSWDQAEEMSKGLRFYTAAAARLVAEDAVLLEEIDDEEEEAP